MTADRTGSGEVLFFDDFAGAGLDPAKWRVAVTESVQFNDELQAYVDTGETVSVVTGAEAGGARSALLLQAAYRPGFTTPHGNSLDFVSGKVETAGIFDFAYGVAAARIKVPAGPGYWPAFWLLGNGAWPDDGEIDVMENVGDPSWTAAAVHGPGYSGGMGPVNRAYFDSVGLPEATEWHVYRVQWGPDLIRFDVDGKVFHSLDKARIEVAGRWAFDSPKFLILNLAIGGIYPWSMSGITEPYHGLPASTLAALQRGEGRMLIDWVRVSRLPE